MNSEPDIPIDLLFRAIRMHLEQGVPLAKIGAFLKSELKRRGLSHIKMNRESPKKLLRTAIKKKMLRFVPPENVVAHAALVGAAGNEPRGIHVVDVDDMELVDLATSEAAGDVAFELISTIASTKKVSANELPEVHLGIGCGRTTRLVGERLGQRLAGAIELRNVVKKIVFHAISCGFDPARSLESPVAIFTLLEKASVAVEFVGLFSDAVVSTDMFADICKGPGVKRSFERRSEIDIVITSMSGADDGKGLWNMYAKEDSSVRQRLEDNGWVGDVQFRPYSKLGPITVDVGIRAVTLFELRDLVKMAGDRKKAVLLVAPAKEGLEPLIVEPSLRVFSHLVTDIGTVRHLYPKAFEV